MEFFVFVGFILVFIILVLLLHNRLRTEAETQIKKLVKQAGGKQITIEESNQFKSRKGIFRFKVTYFDSNRTLQTRYATAIVERLGSSIDVIHWDQPLQAPVDNTRLESKEQIISDMDAEIKRLQDELARVKKEASEK